MPVQGSSAGAVVRALASHQCVPGSIPRLGVKYGLILLILYLALRGWSGYYNFPLSSTFDRAVFSWVSKVISELLWFCIASLSDWFKVLAPFFQPLRSETETNRGLRVHISRAFCRLRVITSSFDWFTALSPSFLLDHSNYFGFGFTTLDWNSHYDTVKLIWFLCIVFPVSVRALDT